MKILKFLLESAFLDQNEEKLNMNNFNMNNSKLPCFVKVVLKVINQCVYLVYASI